MVTLPSRPKKKYVYGNSPRDIQLRLNERAFFERMAIEEFTRVNLTSVVRRYVSFCDCLRLRPFSVSFKTLGLTWSNTAMAMAIQHARCLGSCRI